MALAYDAGGEDLRNIDAMRCAIAYRTQGQEELDVPRSMPRLYFLFMMNSWCAGEMTVSVRLSRSAK